MTIKGRNILGTMKIAMLILLCGMSGSIFAENGEVAPKREYTPEEQQELWQQPDFVKAYLVAAEPAGALYSIFGHACLRMVCDAYDLDCCFSYESEGAVNKIFTFLSGNLHMGMRRIQTSDYLEECANEGRGVREYELNLPIDVKRNLWRVLDEKTAEGMELPYDYVARGCIYACVTIIEEALGEQKIEYGIQSPRYNRTRREICNDYAKVDYPWNMMCIMGLVGTEVDRDVPPHEKLIITTEVIEVLQNAKVDGEYLLSREYTQLLPSTQNSKASWFTPTIVALLFLLLAIVALFINVPYIDWLILGIVTLIGLLLTYMVVFSTLPCTNWNWLIIPFNVLPVLCWKWRKYWTLPYAGIIGIWCACMIASPHVLVDKSMVVLAIAFMMILLNKRNRKPLNLNQK